MKPTTKNPAKKAAATPPTSAAKKLLTTAPRTRLTGSDQTPAPSTVHESPTAAHDSQLVHQAPVSGAEGISGSIDRSDVSIPQLKLVQSIGPLSEIFEPGLLVINNEAPITDEPNKDNPTPLSITIIGLQKQFEENLEWGSDDRPRVFDTEAEVAEAGGHLNWAKGPKGKLIKPPFSPVASILVAVKAPDVEDEGILSHFPYEFNCGKDKALAQYNGFYTVVVFRAKGAGYTRMAKPIITAATMSDLKTKGLISGAWAMGARREKLGENLVYVPVIKRIGSHPPAFIEFLRGLN